MPLALGIMGSPRRGGNAERLLAAFLQGVERAGATVRWVWAAERAIGPCRGCRHCEREGFCRLHDDMDELYRLLREADLVALATPVFFYGLPSQLKALVDRTQALWARRYRLGLRDPKCSWRKGVLLAVGATRGRNLFVGVELTARYFFDAIGASLEGTLGVHQVEAPGDLERRPEVLQEACRWGEQLAGPLVARRRVLFVGHRNAARSQMAEAFAQLHAGDRLEAESAGLQPAAGLDPDVLRAMAERGVDLAFRRPRGLAEASGPFDLVVQVAREGDGVAAGGRVERWGLEDPAGKPWEIVRRVRDEVEARVRELLARMG